MNFIINTVTKDLQFVLIILVCLGVIGVCLIGSLMFRRIKGKNNASVKEDVAEEKISPLVCSLGENYNLYPICPFCDKKVNSVLNFSMEYGLILVACSNYQTILGAGKR